MTVLLHVTHEAQGAVIVGAIAVMFLLLAGLIEIVKRIGPSIAQILAIFRRDRPP